MKAIKFIIAGFLTLSLSISYAQVSFGEAEQFNDGWTFQLGDDAAASDPVFDDSNWRKLQLPHDWSIEGRLSPSLASCTGYLPGGIGWYRKHFTIKDDAHRHYIYFEGIYNRSKVYLNGHLLGERPNGYISFLYDMTPYLKDGDNVLAVRVDHSRYADSRWYTGSGIYRDVWMISSPDVHLAQWGVSYQVVELTDRRAVVNVDIAVEKHEPTDDPLEVSAGLYDDTGHCVAQKRIRITDDDSGTTTHSLTLRVMAPHRWDVEYPYLYTLKTTLFRNDRKIDECLTRAGFRTIEFDADRGFALNGRWMKVKGVCLHHDAGVLGAVVPKEVWHRRLVNLREIGVNAIRTSHNPQTPVVYDLCDELGLLVMDEISDEWEFPKRKWIEGWNVGTPGFDGTYDFFEEWIDRDVTDMVRRDRNHPSVFMWSIGNEVDYPNDPYSHPILDGSKISQPMFGGYNPDAPSADRIGKIAKRLAACVRAVDLSRPVTGALAGVVMSNETEYPEAIDVVGYNYTEDRYDEDHAKYPDRIIYGSENRPDIAAWYAVRDKEFIFGQFIWTGTDYLGESNPWPSRGFYTGLLDLASFRKPRGWFQATLWSDKPVTYLGTYPSVNHLSVDAWDLWNYEDGQSIRAVCYTNAPYARLLLNGKVVGEPKPYDSTTGIIYWDIPYSAGELRAEGCDAEGNVLSSYAIHSSGRPYALRVSADNTRLDSNRATTHIVVEVVDEESNLVKLGDSEITCTCEGPIRLLGLEGSDNSDMGDYTDNRQRAYHGRLLAYMQTTGERGKARIRFTSPLLKGTQIDLTIE